MPDESGSQQSDLERLAGAADHQRRWGVTPSSPELADIASMTHRDPGPNPAAPYLDAARNAAQRGLAFWQGGLTGAFPQLHQYMPPGVDPVGRVFQSQAARDALSSANVGGTPLIQAFGVKNIIPGYFSPEARDYYNRTFGRSVNEKDFIEGYFGGMHNPSTQVNYYDPKSGYGGQRELRIQSDLKDQNGEKIGAIKRTLRPERQYAYHNSLDIDPEFQRQGYSKNILRGQFNFYEKSGITDIGIFAVGEGSAQWGKEGFLPTIDSWNMDLKPMIGVRAARLPLNPVDKDIVERALKSGDPKAMWSINDIDTPYNIPRGYKSSNVGRELLNHLTWDGHFSYHDIEQVERKNAYLKPR